MMQNVSNSIPYVYQLTPKEAQDLREHNLNFDRFFKLEKWSNEFEFLVCGG